VRGAAREGRPYRDLAAAEFGDRCDASPQQISIRCAPVARLAAMAKVLAAAMPSQRFATV
jgi:hypothetical protein